MHTLALASTTPSVKRTANIYLTSAAAVLFVLVTAAAGPLVEAALGADGGQLSGQLLSGRMGAVAAEHRLASEAGLEILALGGNAIDAAVAATLATGVVNPSSAGLGGGGFMLLWLADGRGARALDFRETAPSAARRDTFMSEGLADDASRRGGLAVAVPGEAAGMAWALQHYGSLSMAEVAAPAIRLAEQGFKLEAHLSDSLARHRDELAANPSLASEFLHDDGSPFAEGETLRRPKLARTLRVLADEGPSPFYSGPIARDLLAALRAHGGIMSEEDLRDYRVIEREPVAFAWRGQTVLGMPPPSSGGGLIGQVLAVLAPYRLAQLEHNSASYSHLLAEAMRAAFADRARWYGDPAYFDVPLARLLSPRHADWVRSRLSAVAPVPARTWGGSVTSDDAGTSHVSVIDSQGNAAACTSSVNTGFGAMLGVPGRGYPLNNTMDDFSLRPGRANVYGLVGSEANSVAGGKRPLSSMSPTLLVADGKARMAVGASGGPLIISGTLQALLNATEFAKGPLDAISAPRLHHQWMPDLLMLEQGAGQHLADSLRRRGHKLVVGKRAAAVQMVVRRDDGTLLAASDPRKGGVAAAR